MGIVSEEKAQGATEYLLMLAAVLIIVAAAVYYVVGMKGTASGVIENQENQIENAIT